MSFPLENKEKGEEFLKKFFEKIKEEKVIYEKVSKIGELLKITITDKEITLNVDTRNKFEINFEKLQEEPSAILHFSSSLFHKIFCGEMNPFFALKSNLIKVEGKAKAVIDFVRTIPMMVGIYKELLDS